MPTPSHNLPGSVDAIVPPTGVLGTGQPADADHLTLSELAKWLRCSTRTLQRLLSVGDGPPVIRLSERRLIFPLRDARSWLASRTKAASPPKTHRRVG
jgi:hypothetical protein